MWRSVSFSILLGMILHLFGFIVFPYLIFPNLDLQIVLQWLGQMALVNQLYSNWLQGNFNQALERYSVQPRYLLFTFFFMDSHYWIIILTSMSSSSTSCCKIHFCTWMVIQWWKLHSLFFGSREYLIKLLQLCLPSYIILV